MSAPLVSIIIPAYNSEKYLADAINSALAQNWPNKEVIVVDDGSADQSLQIATSFECDAVKIIAQKNAGAAAARNRGLKEAKGKYIQFLDADDLIGPDKIANQVALLEKHPGRLTMCSTVHFFNNELHEGLSPSAYEEAFLFDDDNPAHFVINLYGGYSTHGSMIAVHAWLSPRAVIDKAGPWNEELSLDDDGEFFCRVMLKSDGIVKSDGFCYYRKYTDQRSLSAQKTEANLLSSLKSTISKKRHLLAVNNSFEAKAVIYKALLNLAVQSYLKYPTVYEQAMLELPPVKLKYQPALGGKLTTLLTTIFGWRFVKFLQLKR